VFCWIKIKLKLMRFLSVSFAGVVASQGGIPHALHRSPQLAPYLLTGTAIPAAVLKAHLFTETVASREQTLPAALKWAKLVTECSPDAVMCTKDQINDWQEGFGVSEVARRGALTTETARMYDGRNITEGLESFVEASFGRVADARVGSGESVAC